jgi:hypothetical protein
MRQASITPLSAASVRTQVISDLRTFGVNLDAGDTVTMCPADTYLDTDCPENTILPGSEKQLMVLAVAKKVASLTFPGALSDGYLLHAQVVGRNEPE